MDKLLESYYRVVNLTKNHGVEGLRAAFIETYGYDPVTEDEPSSDRIDDMLTNNLT